MSAEARRIHFFRGRRKQIIDAEFFEGNTIGLESAGVFLKILRRAELLWIHENRNDHRRTLATRFTNERKMPFMQGSHGGHETEKTIARARFAGHLLHPRNGVD